MEDEWNNVAIRTSTKQKLTALKIHPNQSYDEVINELIDLKENQKR